MAWQLFLDNAWRTRVGGIGTVLGIETGRAQQRLEAAGIESETADDLLSACEAGFAAAVNERDDNGGEE